MNKIEIKPKKKYLYIGIIAIIVLIILFFYVLIMKEERLLIICSIFLFPLLLCFALCFLFPYFQKRIIIENQSIEVISSFGKKKEIYVGQITKLRMNTTLERVEVFVEKKKIFYACKSYENYFELVCYLKENTDCKVDIK